MSKHQRLITNLHWSTAINFKKYIKICSRTFFRHAKEKKNTFLIRTPWKNQLKKLRTSCIIHPGGTPNETPGFWLEKKALFFFRVVIPGHHTIPPPIFSGWKIPPPSYHAWDLPVVVQPHPLHPLNLTWKKSHKIPQHFSGKFPGMICPFKISLGCGKILTCPHEIWVKHDVATSINECLLDY